MTGSNACWNLQYIRRPRPTQGGARQGREVVNTKTIHNNNNSNSNSNSSNSNSNKKKQPKSSFSMRFTSYVRHFRGAILEFLRPSPRWCFPIRGPAAARGKSSQIIIFYGFRSYVRHFRGAILGFLRPSLPWCFPIRGLAAAAAKAFAAAGGKASQNS